ncbi:MAG TPA: thioredoxin family protein [Pyrinomonadaceae bacterium]|nr:thioredoxin family protein [Pyrinomonadaceae bacterium]
MKLIVLSFLISLFIFVSSTNARQIDWLTDYKTANKLAVDTGKPMLLDFTANWCKPCREMEKDFWSRADVIELSKDFVCVKVDLEKNKSLVEKYVVATLPNVILTDSWGNGVEFHRGFGINGVREITEKLLALPKDFSEIKEARKIIASDKKNLAALEKIADFYQRKKFYYLSSEFYNRMLKLEKDISKRELLMLNLAENYLQIGWNAEAKDMLKTIKKEFPNSARMEKVDRDLANL